MNRTSSRNLRDYLIEGLEQRLLLSAGMLDPSFGVGGMIELPVDNSGGADAIVVQPDGKILLALDDSSTHSQVVLRYFPNGAPDNSFGLVGEAKMPALAGQRGHGRSLSLLSDGKILLIDAYDVGTDVEDNRLAQLVLNANGTVASTALDLGADPGPDDLLTAFRSDGKSVHASDVNGELQVSQFNADGTYDASFGGGGSVLTNLPDPLEENDVDSGCVAIQPDGAILVETVTLHRFDNHNYLLRYLSDYPDPDDQIAEAPPIGDPLADGAMTKTRYQFDPEEKLPSGTPPPERLPAPLAQSIDDPRDVDMYSFTVEKDQVIGFDIDLPASSSLDSYIRLFDSSGVQLAANDNARGPGEPFADSRSYLEYPFTTGGTYYVAVSSSGNTAYDAVTGAGDDGGATTGEYYLIVSPGLTGTITGDVGLGLQTFVVDILSSGLNPPPIDSTVGETWIITHGRNSSRTSNDIPKGAPNVAGLISTVSDRPGAQVLSLDWSGPAFSGGGTDFRQEDWIEPVADWAALALRQYNFSGSTLNLIGHSWGANLSDEIAKRMLGGVNSIVALDPAANGISLPAIVHGGAYDPDISVNFSAHSAFSWSFYSPDSDHFPVIPGDDFTAATASEAIVVRGSEHSEVVNLFLWMLQNPTQGASPYFKLDRLVSHIPSPYWKPNFYLSDGSRFPPPPYDDTVDKPFEAVIHAGPTRDTALDPPEYVPLQSSGNLDVGAATLDLDSSYAFTSVAIAAGGLLIVDPGAGAMRTAQLTIASGGSLDLNDNDLVLSYTGGSPASGIGALLASGRGDGAWDGTGIMTSATAAHPGTGLGYVDTPVPAGQPAGGSILVRYTLAGDANLDRTVDFTDLVTVAQNYDKTNAIYANGDTNLDGTVGFADLVAVAQNYGKSLAPPSNQNHPPIATDDSFVTDENVPLFISAPGLLANDTDADSDALTANLASGAAYGDITLNVDGSFSYSPIANFNGTDSFTYRVNDGKVNSAPATVFLTVTAHNVAAIAAFETQAAAKQAIPAGSAAIQVRAESPARTNASRSPATLSSIKNHISPHSIGSTAWLSRVPSVPLKPTTFSIRKRIAQPVWSE